MENVGLIEMAFSFGVFLALALFDLWRTPKPGDDPDDGASSEGSDSDELSR